ncbi:MAG TPA: DUF2283 domain-containing protein [bacterium]|nr:DUF2283 domain-containing protein [bacterium]
MQKRKGYPTKIFYYEKTDLLYLRFEEKKQDVVNKKIHDYVVLDIGEEDKLVGIEILDASKHLIYR